MRVRLLSTNPGNIAGWQGNELSRTAASVTNVNQSATIELTSLEKKTVQFDSCCRRNLVLLKARNELEFIDGDFQLTC